MLSCRRFVEQTTATPSPEDLQGWSRWSTRLHWLMCRHCRRYLRQLRTMLNTLPYLQAGETDTQTVDKVWQAIQAQEKPAGPS